MSCSCSIHGIDRTHAVVGVVANGVRSEVPLPVQVSHPTWDGRSSRRGRNVGRMRRGTFGTRSSGGYLPVQPAILFMRFVWSHRLPVAWSRKWCNRGNDAGSIPVRDTASGAA